MIWLLFGIVAFLVVGILICVKHDAPEHYAAIRRLLSGFVVALALGSVLYAAEISPPGCNDFEKYSFFWYYYLCFLNEGSH